MTLTHSRNNNWADSATYEPAHNGLTDFGKEIVREMNRLEMVDDVPDVADKTFYDALEVTTKPVMLYAFVDAGTFRCSAKCDGRNDAGRSPKTAA